MCRLCVCVLINKRSFEPCMCLEYRKIASSTTHFGLLRPLTHSLVLTTHPYNWNSEIHSDITIRTTETVKYTVRLPSVQLKQWNTQWYYHPYNWNSEIHSDITIRTTETVKYTVRLPSVQLKQWNTQRYNISKSVSSTTDSTTQERTIDIAPLSLQYITLNIDKLSHAIIFVVVVVVVGGGGGGGSGGGCVVAMWPFITPSHGQKMSSAKNN